MALAAPGPDPAQLADLLRLAVRVPDHGKLAPWRFVILRGEAKDDFAERITARPIARPNPVKRQGRPAQADDAAVAVAVISRFIPGEIPEMGTAPRAPRRSARRAAASRPALGWGANWITDWYSCDPRATAILGLAEGEQVAGYLYLGATTEQPQERVRPDVAAITSEWSPA
ncbi:nitroreductase family protein [Caulobacter segnis]